MLTLALAAAFVLLAVLYGRRHAVVAGPMLRPVAAADRRPSPCRRAATALLLPPAGAGRRRRRWTSGIDPDDRTGGRWLPPPTLRCAATGSALAPMRTDDDANGETVAGAPPGLTAAG